MQDTHLQVPYVLTFQKDSAELSFSSYVYGQAYILNWSN